MTETICEWMIFNKIAENGFSARHIESGLKLWHYDRPTQEAMCKLYRKWRPKTDKKNELLPKEVYDLVLAGIDPDDIAPRQMNFGDVVSNVDLEMARNFASQIEEDILNGRLERAIK